MIFFLFIYHTPRIALRNINSQKIFNKLLDYQTDLKEPLWRSKVKGKRPDSFVRALNCLCEISLRVVTESRAHSIFATESTESFIFLLILLLKFIKLITFYNNKTFITLRFICMHAITLQYSVIKLCVIIFIVRIWVIFFIFRFFGLLCGWVYNLDT